MQLSHADRPARWIAANGQLYSLPPRISVPCIPYASVMYANRYDSRTDCSLIRFLNTRASLVAKLLSTLRYSELL